MFIMQCLIKHQGQLCLLVVVVVVVVVVAAAAAAAAVVHVNRVGLCL
jgi:hypothetical protein